jgi:hypothetical protein
MMLFIETHGADIADRYLKYDMIQTAKAVGQYERYCEKLGHELHLHIAMCYAHARDCQCSPVWG